MKRAILVILNVGMLDGWLVLNSGSLKAQSLGPAAATSTNAAPAPSGVTATPSGTPPDTATPSGAPGSTEQQAPSPVGFPGTAANRTPPKGTESMEPIVVTGSYIPTTDTTEGPSPLTIITPDQIAARGDTTLDQALSHLPEAGSFSNKGVGGGDSFNGAASFISLKGLGPQATLVLINGLRTAPFGDTANGQYAFTDLNSISVASIDQIQVLTDGASAIYGSDAIAGVVNIILKKDLGNSDAQTTVQLGNTTDHDAFEQVYSQSFGLSSLDHNGNGIVVLDFYNRNSIFDRDRSYSQTPNLTGEGGADLRSYRTFPGTFVGTVPGTPEDGPASSNAIFGSDEFSVNQGSGALTAGSPNEVHAVNPATGLPTTVQPYNYLSVSTLVPSTSRYGFYTNYGYDFYGGDVRPNIDFSYRHIKTFFDMGASGYEAGDNLNDFPNAVVPIPTTNYYNRTGQEIDILSYRFLDIGDRTLAEATDDFRVVPSIDVNLGDKWKMSADFNWSYSWTTDVEGGAVSASGLQNALNSANPLTAYNPFTNNVNANSAAVLNEIRGVDEHDAYTSLLGEDIRFNGPTFDLPAGPVELSLGAEHRIDRYNQNYSPEDLSGDILGESVIQDTAAARSVTSGYAETHIPVLGKGFNFTGVRSFDVWGAARVDSYSDFGTTINPEARFVLYPVKDLLIRGSFSTGFRAPSLPELFAGGNQSFESVADPQTGTEPQVLVVGGGNGALQPERSENYNVGIVYTPSFIPGLTVHSDLYKIRYTDQIEQVNPQTEVTDGSPNVTRDAAGNIVSITASYENLANSLIQGIDSGFTYAIGDPTKPWGLTTFLLDGSWTLNYLTQAGPGQPFEENAGQDSQGLGAYPRYRQTASITWDYRSFEFVGANDYTSGTNDTQAIDNNGNPVSHKIDAYSTFDVQASYSFVENKHDYYSAKTGVDWKSWLDGTKFTLGCDNVAQFKPPLTLNPDNDVTGTDSTYADYRGRFVYGAFNKVW